MRNHFSFFIISSEIVATFKDIKMEELYMSKSNEFIIASVTPENYNIFDKRSIKPIYLKEMDNSGSAVIEELDYIKVDNNKEKLMYLPPNPIAIQLSIVQDSIKKAKEINANSIFQYNKNKLLKEKVYEHSNIIYDHITLIQQAIVFGYTALETFANLSIPDHFEYSTVNNKKVTEVYNKDNIERWISLNDKLSKILVEVYKTDNITKKQLWSDFLQLERYRHEIIHQKSVEHVSFYRKYFKNNIYKFLSVPENIIKFFYEQVERQGKTNRIWPWINTDIESIPTKYGAKGFFSQTEVIGNLYEGKMK